MVGGAGDVVILHDAAVRAITRDAAHVIGVRCRAGEGHGDASVAHNRVGVLIRNAHMGTAIRTGLDQIVGVHRIVKGRIFCIIAVDVGSMSSDTSTFESSKQADCFDFRFTELFHHDFLYLNTIHIADADEINTYLIQMEMLQAVRLIEAEDLLPQSIENADIAFFSKFDVEAATGWVGINGVGFWCNYLFNFGDKAGAWESDVVNPGAVAARLSIVVLDVEPFEHMTSGFEIKLCKGPVILA